MEAALPAAHASAAVLQAAALHGKITEATAAITASFTANVPPNAKTRRINAAAFTTRNSVNARRYMQA